jgi:5-methylcytosine-specific restriction endonuclease McrA
VTPGGNGSRTKRRPWPAAPGQPARRDRRCCAAVWRWCTNRSLTYASESSRCPRCYGWCPMWSPAGATLPGPPGHVPVSSTATGAAAATAPARPPRSTTSYPGSRGGKNTWLNTVAACGGCNQRKGDRPPTRRGCRCG